MFTYSLKKHLQNHHPTQNKELQNAKSDRLASKRNKSGHDATASTSQLCIEQQIQGAHYYSKNSKRQEAITKKLAVFVGARNVPLSLVDGEVFHDFLCEMDKRYRVFHKKKFGQAIENVMSKLKVNISLVLENAQIVTFVLTLSNPRLTASIIGAVLHTS
uniref:Uncharacterized protein n=1 Tax=Amphimedon queenslandica TaxID=400682 RepID=A0A1X7U6W5_AMPQE